MASQTPYASNAFGVETAAIDHTAEGTPTVQTYHGGTIAVGNNVIGRINEFQAAGAYNREMSHVYEVNHKTWGNPCSRATAIASPARCRTAGQSRRKVWLIAR